VIGVTLGGVLVGLCILARHSIKWYPGLEKLKSNPVPYLGDWLPFLFGWAYGALGALTAMGLIGWAFDTALWASNWLGDAALWVGVGEAPGQTASGAPLQLSSYGNCTMVLLTIVVITIAKCRPSGSEIKHGTWCGLCLGTSTNIAGAAAGPLAMGVNWIGTALFGALT
jgi:hypothetical protein